MIFKKKRRNRPHPPSRTGAMADLRHAVNQELKDPWGRINCSVGIILLFLLIADITQGLLVELGISFHWKWIKIAFSLHGVDDVLVSVALVIGTIIYWMFCINSFKQLRPQGPK